MAKNVKIFSGFARTLNLSKKSSFSLSLKLVINELSLLYKSNNYMRFELLQNKAISSKVYFHIAIELCKSLFDT